MKGDGKIKIKFKLECDQCNETHVNKVVFGTMSQVDLGCHIQYEGWHFQDPLGAERFLCWRCYRDLADDAVRKWKEAVAASPLSN